MPREAIVPVVDDGDLQDLFAEEVAEIERQIRAPPKKTQLRGGRASRKETLHTVRIKATPPTTESA